ncbi:sulfotransferase domain-containing protein [Formosa sp. A9]|uniref:sulfotransferase domain-containing protein n=1 Tax=Formosa sp. A9 TaxID=3442641 RepID=UPI003EBB9BF5
MELRKQRLIKIFVTYIYKYYPKQYDKTIWLIGSGRSGTTWVSSLINFNNSFRELFEPFHPSYSELSAVGFCQHKYLNDANDNIAIETLSSQILKGNFYQKRSEEANRFIWQRPRYKNMLIKDIFTNLLAYQICKTNKYVKPVLLIRNPFSVALSKSRTKDWYWMTDPIDFLNQKELMNDFLNPFENLIKDISKNGTHLDKQILIWSIINYVPLKQFKGNELLVTFYEDWVINPEKELNRIQEFVKLDLSVNGDFKDFKKFKKPSKTSVTNNFSISNWKSQINQEQLKSASDILERFGFKELYDENSIPNHFILESLIEENK